MTFLARFRIASIEPGETVDTTLHHLVPAVESDAPGIKVTVQTPADAGFGPEGEFYVQVTPNGSYLP